jgi:hypothetical protein
VVSRGSTSVSSRWPSDQAADPDQPARLAQQVGQDAQAEEARLGHLLGGELLEHETDAEQHGSHEGRCVIYIQIHGALP